MAFKTAFRLFPFLASIFIITGAAESSGPLEPVPGNLLARGGVCVLIGNSGKEAAAAERIVNSGAWVVHWLDPDENSVDSAREFLRERGVYGRASVERWNLDVLPYTDNFVNLLILAGGALAPGDSEIMRVLAPGGAAFIFNQDGGVDVLEKARPEGMGEWTHPWNEACGNPVSSDVVFDAPNAFQWVAGPPFPMFGRKDSTRTVLSSGGRVFYLTQNVPENMGGAGGRYLVARDAFNGVKLWSVEWEGPDIRYPSGKTQAIAAAPERIYAASGDGVSVLDAMTGEKIEVLSAGGRPDKILLIEGIVVAQLSGGLAAFDANEVVLKWEREIDGPWGSLGRGGRIFSLSSSREVDGRWRHDLLATELGTGEELWSTRVEGELGPRQAGSLAIYFAADGIVAMVERNMLKVVSADTGKELWSRESGAEARPDARNVGHFFKNGLVWMRDSRGSGWDTPEKWTGLDPLTGEVADEIEATGRKGVIFNVAKWGCQPITVTERLVLDARLATTWDFSTGERQGWKFSRGGCTVGMIPANGLGYVPPNACGCLAEQLRGYLALVKSDDPGITSFEPSEPEKGPEYGLEPGGSEPSGWPVYRADSRRSAFYPGEIQGGPDVLWHSRPLEDVAEPEGEWLIRYGSSFSPPSAGGGMVFFSHPDSHRVIALNSSTGEKEWSFTAGGRVTLPPAVHGGMAFFGANDGYVYALRADNGGLAWRLRAAPSHRRIKAYGQVESAWPVSGGVLVFDGMLLAAAGRAADSDGGVVVHAIEPGTGNIIWTSRIEEARFGMPDVLVTDGSHVYLMNYRIDAETGETTALHFQHGRSDRGGVQIRHQFNARYLRSGKAGFLNTGWTSLDIALRRAQSTWSWGTAEGEVMSFSGSTAYSYQVDAGAPSTFWSNPHTRGGGKILAEGWGRPSPFWSFEVDAPSQVESVVSSENILLVSGPDSRVSTGGPGFVRAIDIDGGDELWSAALPSVPVFDGVAASDGKILAVLKDGSVICLGN